MLPFFPDVAGDEMMKCCLSWHASLDTSGSYLVSNPMFFSGHSDLGPAAFLSVDLNNPSPEKHAWKYSLPAQKNDPSKRQQ